MSKLLLKRHATLYLMTSCRTLPLDVDTPDGCGMKRSHAQVIVDDNDPSHGEKKIIKSESDSETATMNRQICITNNLLVDVQEYISLLAGMVGTDPAKLKLVFGDNYKKCWQSALATIEKDKCGQLQDIGPFCREYYKIEHPLTYNAKLIFRPDPQSDVRMKTIKFSDLPDPLKGKIDLSGFQLAHNLGSMDQYNVIMTDPEAFFDNDKESNFFIANWDGQRYGKLFTLIITHAHVRRHSEEPWAKTLFQLMPLWKPEVAPVSIVWRIPGNPIEEYDYLITTLNDILSKSLGELFYERFATHIPNQKPHTISFRLLLPFDVRLKLLYTN